MSDGRSWSCGIWLSSILRLIKVVILDLFQDLSNLLQRFVFYPVHAAKKRGGLKQVQDDRFLE